MKKKFPIVNIVKVFVVIVIIILIAFFSLNYTIYNNENYLSELGKEIFDKCEISGDINSVNVYGGYYIVSSSSEVIVLDMDYKEVFKDVVSKLSDNINDYDLVYKNNKLMYEETVIGDDILTYNYYDAYSYEKVSSIVLE